MTYKTVDAETLKRWLAKGEAVLVDVRETFEYEAGNIPGAYHVPLGDVTIATLPDYKDKKLVIQCRSGRRSATACQRLLDAGIDADLYNLQGGILAWSETSTAGDSEKTESGLSIEQQVRVIAGGMILATTVLGYLVSPWFYFLVGAMGGALMVSGLTGICLMAQGLAKLPWNKN